MKKFVLIFYLLFCISVINSNAAPKTIERELLDKQEFKTNQLADPITLTVTASDVKCFGGNDGSASASASGGTAPYSYLWSDRTAQMTPTAAGLKVGIYKIIVTDSNGISTSATVTISEPAPLQASVITSDLTCYGANNGTIIIITDFSGGSGNYEYRVGGFGWQNKSQYLNLAPGVYKVEMRDLLIPTCVRELSSVTIKQPDILSATTELRNATCLGNDGTISIVNPKGGSGSYEYSMNSGNWRTSGYFTGLVPGNYHIEMRDLNVPDCIIDLVLVAIVMPEQNAASPSVKITQNPTCNIPFGTLTIVSPLNSAGKTYAYSKDGIIYQPSPVFGTLTGTTTYTITARDIQSGCTSSQTVIYVPAIPPSPVIFVSTINPNCYGETYAISISVPPIVSAGKSYNFDGIYTFYYNFNEKFDNVEIKGGAANITGQLTASKDFNNIRFEANGCPSSGANTSVKIVVPDPIVITQALVTENTLQGTQRGAIDLTVIGSSLKLSYVWTSNTFTSTITTQDLNNMASGTYTVRITDANNCSITKMFKIPLINPPVARPDEFTTVCSSTSGNLLSDNGKGVDYDPDPVDQKDFITVNSTLVVEPSHATSYKINADGTFEYFAMPNYTGDDTFVYEIFDKFHQTATATVTIHIVSDFEGDGIPDLADADADGDGILNVDEVLSGQDWKTTDSDGDGHVNWLDIDSDNDGIVDNVEAQTNKGYIAPSGIDKDQNGIDDAYDPAQGGTKIVPVNTDLTLADPDKIPDFLDVDSDNDWVPDYIEGHDLNADGKPDRIISGKDSDADGLDDVYDIVVKACNNGNATSSNSPLQDFDGDGLKDWRDNNDDDDEYLTRFEDLNADGDYSNDVTGQDRHPEYLWYYQKPIANAGNDQIVYEGVTVTLDGSGSTDGNQDKVSYIWTAPKGILLSNSTSSKPSFLAPEVKRDTILTFTLVVNDGKVNSSPASVKVAIQNVIKVGVTSMETSSIRIYPNPTTGIFKIEGLSMSQRNKIAIYTSEGKLIRKKTYNSELVIIDISSEVSGTYLLVINTKSYKIIKK